MGSAPVGFPLECFVLLVIPDTEMLGSVLLLRMSGYIFLIISNLWSVSENFFRDYGLCSALRAQIRFTGLEALCKTNCQSWNQEFEQLFRCSDVWDSELYSSLMILLFAPATTSLPDKEQTRPKYLSRLQPVVQRCYSALIEFNSLCGNTFGFISWV